MRINSAAILTPILLAIGYFFGIGFLATYEPPGWRVLRGVYGLVVLACVAALVTIWVRATRRRGT
ncbi:MAG: hypothetical protein AB7I30_22785 [Isosphaeraceae bacterium]